MMNVPVDEQQLQQYSHQTPPVHQDEEPASFSALSAILIAQIATHEVVQAAAPAC
jgi:hypothetical protein